MICKDVQKNLSDYLEKRLPDLRQTKFEKHLKACVNCSAELAAFKMIVAEASSLERVAAPDSLWTRIESELEVTDEPFLT
ncbi:zf-HC2 domain-containing protein, partial [candidate division KSB1 bacterium]|nr:zf-HC2 domain-containing protein [candidate division KSB1 bacterium]